MLRFREFLEDIRVSFIACLTLTVFPLTCFVMILQTSYVRFTLNQQIEVYTIFQHTHNPKFSSTKEGNFLETIHAVFGANVAPAKRDAGLTTVINEYFGYTNSFFALSHEERMILLFRKQEIPDLIASARAAYTQVTWHWSPVLWSAFIAWQIVSVIMLMNKWWKESYSMQFFPYTRWWFYGYLLLAFPCSLVIILLLVFYTLRWNRGSAVESKQRIHAEQEYERQCRSYRDAKEREKKSWGDLFPGVYITKRLVSLKAEQDMCDETIRALSKQLTETQERHYVLGAEKKSLTLKQLEFAERIVLPQNQWFCEFEEMYNHPMVNAISVDVGVAHKTITVFTKRFQTISGGAGPFRIDINLYNGGFNAHKAHRGALHSSTGLTRAEEGSFCFGNARKNIQSLIDEYKVNSAVNMMFFSFGTNA